MEIEYKFVKTEEEVIELGKGGWEFVAYIQKVDKETANYDGGYYLMKRIIR
jgi:hypothetical protein